MGPFFHYQIGQISSNHNGVYKCLLKALPISIETPQLITSSAILDTCF